ncbi:Origin recognition complex subunit 2 [Lodderomyces elongisporus]|uniref:Origin recognition complex subunit 2 n=1 Tax=Lodderomyces elongisporus TaxID=36914 RepID=UPI0029228D60|nr:Origin recognition complex subunit 2 [Lodderomyces elongisporus]WLF78581.1 Origin recognition complex subunit 2 [Lodderomyces elongisporus]
MSISPLRSPSKKTREIINVDLRRFSATSLSPVKTTPNGRSGLRSPEKRSIIDLDQSAKKRAKRTLYSRLMQEYEDSSENELAGQELKLAEKILDEYNVNYGSDVELEIDESESKPTRRRRQKRTPKAKSKVEHFSEDSMDSDLDVDYEAEKEIKKTEAKPRAFKRRRKPEVLNKVKSIFQQDDDMFGSSQSLKASSSSPAPAFAPVSEPASTPAFESTSALEPASESNPPSQSRLQSPKRKPAKPTSSFAETLLQSNQYTNNIISGVKNGDEKTKTEAKFEPLPLPKLDTDGHIADEEYLIKYMNGQDPSKTNYERLVDEQAFSLEGPEGYFEQLHARFRSNTKSLSSSAPLVTRDEFRKAIQLGDSLLHESKQALKKVHKSLYHQWCFELSQGFNINFFGVGSKINIINDFAENYFIDWWNDVYTGKTPPQILVVNGYNPNVDFKSIVLQIADILVREETAKLPKHISETVPFLVDYMKNQKLTMPKLVLIVHSIDGEALRSDKIQGLFAQLISIPEIWAITSTDHVNAPLLWDSSKSKNSNLIWHDMTTYEGYTSELSFKDILGLGKSKKFVGSLGAKFVLGSLTENHRTLYRKLMESQLNKMKPVADVRGVGLKGVVKYATELRELLRECLSAFIVANEITFRTMMKEYIDHKMCQLVKDAAGLELLFIPFTYGEIEELSKQEFET